MKIIQPNPNLPIPDADALAHSQACAAMLRTEIVQAGGWLSFARFMDRALYTPGLGYYAAGARKFGPAGDFVTAPEISPLFGQCVARALVDTLSQTQGDILELGPGTGRLAVDVLLTLDQLGVLPRRYYLLDVSGDLRERQQQTLAALPPHLTERVQWLTELPESFTGAIMANEVLDVLPVHLISFAAGWVFERGVALDGEHFVWQDVPALPAALNEPVRRIQQGFPGGMPPDGYITEVAPAVEGWVRSLARILQHGTILLVDYGFRRAEYYHESRTGGTLMCHYRHHAHPDPFLYPGLQDITAHVDFTMVAQSAQAEGLALVGYATQAQFLIQAGITQLLARHDPNDAAHYLALTNQAQRLLSPAEMGEFFKVIGFARGEVEIPALAMARPLPLF